MSSQVLIIEDEPDIRKTIDYNLTKESFTVVQAGSIEEGEKALASNQIDVIILDLMLPDGSGLTLCRDIKSDDKTKHIPIIILTAKTEEVDRVVGFELGADDYVTKPFSVRELILRVKAILKRGPTSNNNSEDDEYSFGELTLNFEAHQLYGFFPIDPIFLFLKLNLMPYYTDQLFDFLLFQLNLINLLHLIFLQIHRQVYFFFAFYINNFTLFDEFKIYGQGWGLSNDGKY